MPSMITLSFQVFLLLIQDSPMAFLPPGFTRFFLVLEVITRFNMGFEKIAGSSVAIYRSSYILCHKTVKYRIGEERLLVVLFLLAFSVGLGFGIVTTMVDVYGNDYHGMLFYHLFVQRPMIGLQGPKRVWLPIRIFGALAVICNAGEFVSYLWIYLFQLHRENALISTANGWATFLAFYIPASVLLLVSLYYYRTSQRRIVKQIAYNRGMQHFQVNFDLFTKFLLVIGIWWMFFLLALFEIEALVYISKVFNVIEGPLIFCIAMCRTRVAFLFKRYFCYDWCCFGCCKSEDFLDGGDCKELSIIDTLRNRDESDENCLPSTSLLPSPFPSSNNRELSKSLFNVRHQAGEVPPPADPDMPVGRVKRLLKSNSLTAIANINFGWRKETSV
eukprot:TCALIF_05392-PA protein Name:"Similar to mthl5 Probable G-protein coupled receptor Mth-like 5 (Drosophila melanogaster)" AED:0.54 eAED:0.54 QI:0/0.25/0.2/0.6/1/1/5/301/387